MKPLGGAMSWRSCVAALCLGAVVALTGCQRGSEARFYAGRSMVFESPRQHRLAAKQGADPAVLPWYAARRDVLPGVAQGVRSATVETSVTFTSDVQQSYRGRNYDNLSVRSYRTQVRQVVR